MTLSQIISMKPGTLKDKYAGEFAPPGVNKKDDQAKVYNSLLELHQ